MRRRRVLHSDSCLLTSVSHNAQNKNGGRRCPPASVSIKTIITARVCPQPEPRFAGSCEPAPRAQRPYFFLASSGTLHFANE
jgi:hypothetical protein